jgi:hypothetical protein
LSTWPTPVMVPPVPAPATKALTLPSVSAQISSAVVATCAAGLSGFSNCMGMKALSRAAAMRAASSMAPFMPLAASVSTTSAPRPRTSLRRSTDMDSGMVMMRRMPSTAQPNARPMPVLPLVGSTMTVSWSILPRSRARQSMLVATRSLTEAPGLLNSSLAATRAGSPSASRFR